MSSGLKEANKIFIISYGCAINQAHTEIMKGLLKKEGFILVDNEGSADLIIMNTCSIKKPTEEKILARAASLIRNGKKLIIAGCLPISDPARIHKLHPNISIVGPYDFLKIADVVKAALSNKNEVIVSRSDFNPLLKPRVLNNSLIAVIPIARGCLGACTYCIDKLIWGRLKSYPKEDIVKTVQNFVKNGVKEIRLSGQDTGPYGWDLGYSLIELLDDILEIPDFFKIRIGMASPDTIMKIIDDLVKTMSRDNRIYRYLHIPVQSGSDRILRLMNRKYSVDDFKNLIKFIRNKLGNNVTIATDIITAFPTEREEDHQATLALLNELKFDIVNLSRYGDRPGVPASKIYPKVHSKIAKRRSQEIHQTIKKISLDKNKSYLNKTLPALILEHDNGSLIGRLDNYKLIIVPYEQSVLGSETYIRITDVTWKTLYGRVIH
ncbi:MAG: tRNA (N(6)-L-threonylcarbamoyladenosine(37)-C(2))-methylthiotransferase [Candidatus Njordarchaeales archaeon]